MMFSVSYSLDLHGAYIFLLLKIIFLPSKVVSMFCNVQTTDLTFVSKKYEIYNK